MDSVEPVEEEPPQRNRWHRIKSSFLAITVEPIIFLSTLAASLEGTSEQSLSIFKICHLNLEYSTDVCLHLTSNKTIESEVQAIETKYVVYRTYLTSGPQLLMVVILGAWSDKNGYKWPMVIAKMGHVAAAAVNLLVTIFENWSAKILFIGSFITGLTGGNAVFMAAAMSYVATKSKKESRTFRFGFMDLSSFIAFPIGAALSGYIVTRWQFLPIFGLVATIRVICLLYVLFVLKNLRVVSANNNGDEAQTLNRTKWKMFKDLFNLTHIKDSALVCWKKRDGHTRLWIWLVLSANWILSIPGFGERHVAYLFFRYKFQWGQDMYGYYSAVGTAFTCAGLLILLPTFVHKLNLSDPAIELLGNWARVLNPIIVGFSHVIEMVWAALPLTLFYPFCFPAMRSFLSKLVHPDEYGKIFALKRLSEAVIPFFAAPAYTQLYEATLETFPSAFYFVSAGCCLISAIIFCIVLADSRRTDIYTIVPPKPDDEPQHA